LVLLRQLRCVDRTRLVKRLGAVREHTRDSMDQALLITLGLVEL
jgi:mRNA-degrading endonuclease toxin of MazEF toxin-antitoxin module